MDVEHQDLYRKYCADNQYVPLFSKPSWLDLIDPNWRVAMIRDQDGVLALPYQLSYHRGLRRIGTPRNSPWSSIISWGSMRLGLESLIRKLPQSSYYRFSIDNWRTFPTSVWLEAQFSLEMSYSQIIDTKGVAWKTITGAFRSTLRSEILKGKDMYEICESDDVGTLYDLISKSYDRQNANNTYDLKTLQRVVEKSLVDHWGQLLFAKAADGTPASGALVLEDARKLHIYCHGSHITDKNRFGIKVLIAHILKKAHKEEKMLDFCGSEIPGILWHNMSFGSTLSETLIVRKYRPRWLSLIIRR